MVRTLERLGVIPWFSRPGVSDDNPYSEALFRTLQYCPTFPTQPFTRVVEVARWVAAFVQWYSHTHQHSAIHFVTPDDRHTGRDIAILAQRELVYRAANEERRGLQVQVSRELLRPRDARIRELVADRSRQASNRKQRMLPFYLPRQLFRPSSRLRPRDS